MKRTAGNAKLYPLDEYVALLERFDREYMAPLRAVNVDGVPMFAHNTGPLLLREDVVVPGLSRPEALANAPDVYDGCFRVPSAIGEGK